LFQSNKMLLNASRQMGLKFAKDVVSSPESAGQAMTEIYKRLSDEIHDRRSAEGYNSDGQYVIIPMTVLNKEQAEILRKIANLYNYPVRTQTLNGLQN